MIVTANTSCSGPSAYAGLAFSYHELVTENFQRLNDQDWKTMIATSPPADVPGSRLCSGHRPSAEQDRTTLGEWLSPTFKPFGD